MTIEKEHLDDVDVGLFLHYSHGRAWLELR
jgi:hypothetical protein